MGDGDRREDERDDILGILRRYRPWYFLLLVLQIAVWGAVVVCAGNSECSFHGQAARLKAMGQDMSVLVPLWLLMSIILVDLGGNLVVLLPNYRKRLENKAEARGRSKGFAEGRAKGIEMARAKGIATGTAESRTNGIAEGIAESIAASVAEGISKGISVGIAEGVAQERARRNAELRAIAKKYGIPESELGIDDEV